MRSSVLAVVLFAGAWLCAALVWAGRGALTLANESTRASLTEEQAANQEAIRSEQVTGAERRRRASLQARLAARGDPERHLRIDLAAGVGELWDGVYPLRRFEIYVGGAPVPRPLSALLVGVPGALVPTTPVAPGTYTMVASWGSHAAPLLGLPPPIEDARWPEGAEPPPQVWDAALVGTWMLYSATPEVVTRWDDARVGSIRVGEVDLAAVLPNLGPGALVHVY